MTNDYGMLDGLFYTRSAQMLFDEMVMHETLKQRKKEVYIPYYQIRYKVVKALQEYKTKGRTHFNLKRVIKEVIRKEKKVGILLPEEL